MKPTKTTLILCAVIFALLLIIYLRGCPKPPKPVLIETTKWVQSKAKLRDSIVYRIRVKDSLRIRHGLVIDTLRTVDSSEAVRICGLDTITTTEICVRIKQGEQWHTELKMSDSIIAQYQRMDLLSDSIERSQAKTIAQCQADKDKAAKGQKWRNTKNQGLGAMVGAVAVKVWQWIKGI